MRYLPVTKTKLSVIARHNIFVKSEACCFIKSSGVLLNNSEPASVSNVVFIPFFNKYDAIKTFRQYKITYIMYYCVEIHIFQQILEL